MDIEICSCCGKPKKPWRQSKWSERYPNGPQGNHFSINKGPDGSRVGIPIETAPATPLAKAFAGHRYGLQALKPAAEPIIVFQRPYEGRPVDNITATGAGVLNIDGGRVATSDKIAIIESNTTVRWGNGGVPEGVKNKRNGEFNTSGRWPANLILECICDPARPDQAEHVDGCPVRMLGEQSGESESKQGHRDPNGTMGYHGGANGTDFRLDGHNDSGTAARFFFQATWAYDVAEQLAAADPIRYVAKSSRRERDAGLDKAVRLRGDLTEEQRALVLAALQKAGIQPLG